MPYVFGDVSGSQVDRICHRCLIAHLLQPVMVTAINVSLTPQFVLHFGTLRGTFAIQGWQNLLRGAEHHVRDVGE